MQDCEQWFFERVLRDRPVPIPAPGVQLTSISHVEDVAAMLAKVFSLDRAMLIIWDPICLTLFLQAKVLQAGRCLKCIAVMLAKVNGSQACHLHACLHHDSCCVSV